MQIPTIGWREWIAFPDLGIEKVKAKVDTGARTSSLHAFDVETVQRGSQTIVRFTVHPLQRDIKTTVICEAPLHDERWIRSSNGKREMRPIILVDAVIGEGRWPIELTLTSRDTMGFRMLLGRQAIRKRCIIDPSQSYLVSRHLKPKKKKRRRKPA